MATLTARDIMTAPPVTVSEDTSLQETAKCMLRGHVDYVLVTDAAGEIQGIMTETDFLGERVPLPFSTTAVAKVLGRWVSEGKLASIYREEREGLVGDFMTRDVHGVTAETPLRRVVELMLDHGVHHMPVLEGPRPIGMVSRQSLLRLLFLGPDGNLEE